MDAKEVIGNRIKEIENAIQNSLTNHSALIGHLDEAKFLLESIFKLEAEAKAVSSREVNPSFDVLKDVLVEDNDLGKPQS